MAQCGGGRRLGLAAIASLAHGRAGFLFALAHLDSSHRLLLFERRQGPAPALSGVATESRHACAWGRFPARRERNAGSLYSHAIAGMSFDWGSRRHGAA